MVIGYIRPQFSETSKGSFGLEKAETPKDCSQGKTNMNSSLKPSKWNEYMFESGKLITYITLTYSLPICLPIYVDPTLGCLHKCTVYQFWRPERS